MIDATVIAAQAVHFAAVFALFGASLFRLYAPPPAPIAARFGRALAKLLRAAAVLAALSALAWWVCLAASLGGGWGDAVNTDVLVAVLLDTEFGQVWIWRLALLAVAIGMVRWLRPSAVTNTAIVVVAGLVVATLAGVGHAPHAGIPDEIGIGAKAAHLLAAGAWLGGLLPLGYALRRAATGEAAWRELAWQALPRFSSMGYFAVTFILFTGCVLAWSHVESFAALTGTSYGRVLVAKILLFLLMTAVALRNRYWLMPARTLPALARGVAVEQAVGAAIVIATALLASLPPAHG
ncbi:MAG TPA: copper homeostasis membrane protein CopD [Xanthobacteraceae bacterium]|nr:copper homeostasis membrane protein CopD [Xanthobacteraceae bacterium]